MSSKCRRVRTWTLQSPADGTSYGSDMKVERVCENSKPTKDTPCTRSSCEVLRLEAIEMSVLSTGSEMSMLSIVCPFVAFGMR